MVAPALLLALQSAAATPAAVPVPVDFDLARLRSAGAGLAGARGCDRSALDAIVVCGRREARDSYPIEEMARLFEPRPLVAEIGLGGAVTGRAFVEQVTLDRGAVSNRFMIGIRLPF